jgi:hypothetical protein
MAQCLGTRESLTQRISTPFSCFSFGSLSLNMAVIKDNCKVNISWKSGRALFYTHLCLLHTTGEGKLRSVAILLLGNVDM